MTTPNLVAARRKNEITFVIIITYDIVTATTREFHISTFTCIPFAELAGPTPPSPLYPGKEYLNSITKRLL